ncbi:MAG TPA: FAD-binding oxidoreductase [Flavobacteriales bacterium]|jgi:FAD/FMN-containing dehydrogenase/Fe-S oxidoreductase|nr:FAD-binding oxidoreductase [Flavobacteriales bacterium]
MEKAISKKEWALLSDSLAGYIADDQLHRIIYSNDASAYEELPLAVVFPANVEDVQQVVRFAIKNDIGLIPRTAGTSLAGQVVGSGLVVDFSKFMNNILEINEKEKWVLVEPGVIRDELNMELMPLGLQFAPETSTSNRAMIGGMVGNNSCGANSIYYGTTRDHLLEIEVVLYDASVAHLRSENKSAYEAILSSDLTLSKTYLSLKKILSKKSSRETISQNSPKKEIQRRNTGYALEAIADDSFFDLGHGSINMCNLMAGSEGTLALGTKYKLNLVPLPPEYGGLLCIQFNNLYKSLEATQILAVHQPYAIELIDHYIIDAAKGHGGFAEYASFITGYPEALLIVQLFENNADELTEKARLLETALKKKDLGEETILLTGNETEKVWKLRKAGLGLLSNIPGAAKPQPVVEDTAVALDDLPKYIKEFNEVLERMNLNSVHYAHAGAGELHLRPIIDMTTSEGRAKFRSVAQAVSRLVRKYNGSLSGEHGDGRLRGEFLREQVGDELYNLFLDVKKAWDPMNIFNPGKIVDAPAMDKNLRYQHKNRYEGSETLFRYRDSGGILNAVERCNGSGDCRKTKLSGGTMCPSFMATRNEKDSTRARANALRQLLKFNQEKAFTKPELHETLSLCLSCKACKSECPSQVDMAKLKSEVLYQYGRSFNRSSKDKRVAHFYRNMQNAYPFTKLIKSALPLLEPLLKTKLNIPQQRTLPLPDNQRFTSWKRDKLPTDNPTQKRRVLLFVDEFHEFTETDTAKKAWKLFEKLGYSITRADVAESGRTYISKGFLDNFKSLATENINRLYAQITPNTAIVGLEPSAIITFRDEYLDIFEGAQQQKAEEVAKSCYTFEEFIAEEHHAGRITSDRFTSESMSIRFHGHCYQKAISSTSHTQTALNIPVNYRIEEIPSGCCGMAGSFGYEHFDISMKIGELVLFPAVRRIPGEVKLCAPGTSCRQQISDGTGRIALHPAVILFNALKSN